MPVPIQDQVRRTLRGVEHVVAGIVIGGWDDWLGSPQSAIWDNRRCRANFVWAQMIHRARLEFDGHNSVYILDSHGTVSFIVEDRVLFRFKKGNEHGLSANYPTQLALAFHDHAQNLFGLPNIQRVEVVYQLNMLETEVTDIVVVGRNGPDIAWTYSLMDQGAEIVPLPLSSPTPQSTPSEQRLVRPRVERDLGKETKHD